MFRRFVILLAAIVCLPARMVAQGSIAIRNVTVIPMTERAPLTGQTVVVRDGRIAAIGPASAVRVPAGVTTVDGTGKYLIPGLFEMHGAHVEDPRLGARPVRAARRDDAA